MTYSKPVNSLSRKVETMRKAYIVAAKRSAIGTFMGSLTDVEVADFGAAVLKETIAQAKIDPKDLDEVLIGNVIAAVWGKISPDTLPSMPVSPLKFVLNQSICFADPV